MDEIVVKTVEDLKSIRKVRSHPVILIQGELANNLLISGILRPNEQDTAKGEVVKLRETGSAMYTVTEILYELSRANLFEIKGAGGGKQIKISPKPFIRREGN
ncbi:MAG: hypothetical protein WBG50_06990 [Desulfomonilaceae bacterium]